MLKFKLKIRRAASGGEGRREETQQAGRRDRGSRLGGVGWMMEKLEFG